jgi:hypothetical protein
MNIFQLVNLESNQRIDYYSTCSSEQLLSLYNQLPKFIEHPNFAMVKIELDLIYNFSLKPIKID